MKKLVVWLVILPLLLLFTACSTEKESDNPTEFRVACFGCKQEFPSGQLNVDFGLCQDCMMKVGAAYCQNCAAPCYTRDMIQGLCRTCSASRNETTALQESTSVPEMVTCEYCGYSVRSDCMIGDYCVGCYSVRQGKCLRCTHNSRLSDGCHCAYCSENWFYCANCDKRTAGNDMFLDLCMDCYWRINSVLVPCPLCGASYTPQEMKDGYCHTCYPQASYDQSDEHECTRCGREYDTADGHYGGLCHGCYCEMNGLCIICAARPSDGMGPSGMECSECHYEAFGTCLECGYDYWKEDMYGDYCYHCYNNGVACENCSGYYYGWEMVDGYCPICQINPYSDCDHCGVSFLIRDLSLGLCEDCGKLCNHCWVSPHDGIYEDDYVLCTNCFFEFYCYCNGCGEIFAIEDLTDRYCQECYPKYQGQSGGMEE